MPFRAFVTPPHAAAQGGLVLSHPVHKPTNTRRVSAPQEPGKPCLVLDMDETLSHTIFSESDPTQAGYYCMPVVCMLGKFVEDISARRQLWRKGLHFGCLHWRLGFDCEKAQRRQLRPRW